MAITITDIAKQAGVSPSTVSRVCNNNPAISEMTRKKVLSAMEDLGYTNPSVTKTNQIHNIGIIYPTLRPSTTENAFYLEAFHGIANFCNKNQISITLHLGETIPEIIESIKNSPAQGFIFLYSDVDDILIKYMYKHKLQFVLLGKATVNINETIYVDTDNVRAGKDATDYLISLGHQQIAYIGTDNHRVFSGDRKAGYLLSINEANLEYNPEYILELPTRVNTEYTALERLLLSDNPPTALIICDDILAVSILPILRKLKIAVPDDISLICFNNSLLSKLANPPLTSIDINSCELCYQACAQLCNFLTNTHNIATKTLIPHQLIIRESTAPPHKD